MVPIHPHKNGSLWPASSLALPPTFAPSWRTSRLSLPLAPLVFRPCLGPHRGYVTRHDAAVHGPCAAPWLLSYGLATPWLSSYSLATPLAHALAASPPSSDVLCAWPASCVLLFRWAPTRPAALAPLHAPVLVCTRSLLHHLLGFSSATYHLFLWFYAAVVLLLFFSTFAPSPQPLRRFHPHRHYSWAGPASSPHAAVFGPSAARFYILCGVLWYPRPLHTLRLSHCRMPLSSRAHAAHLTASVGPHTVPLCLLGTMPASLASSTIALTPSDSRWAMRLSLSPGPSCRTHACPGRSPRFPSHTSPAHSPIDARSDPRVHTPPASHRRRLRSPHPHQWHTHLVDPPPPIVPALTPFHVAHAFRPLPPSHVYPRPLLQPALRPWPHSVHASPRAILVGDCIYWVASHIDSRHCCLGAHTSRTTASVPRPRSAAPTRSH